MLNQHLAAFCFVCFFDLPFINETEMEAKKKTKAAGEAPKLAGKAARPETNGLKFLARAAIGLEAEAIFADGVTAETRFNSPQALMSGYKYDVGPRFVRCLEKLMNKASRRGTVSVQSTVDAVEAAFDVKVPPGNDPEGTVDHAIYALPEEEQEFFLNATYNSVAIDLDYVKDPKRTDEEVWAYLAYWFDRVPSEDALEALKAFISRKPDISLEHRCFTREHLEENQGICDDESVAWWFSKN